MILRILQLNIEKSHGIIFCDYEDIKDQFDLKNDFSNETYAKAFGSPVYRINVPTDGVEWGNPIQSVKLEKLLYPTVNHNFIVTTSKEHVMLIEQIRDIDNELNQGEET